MFSILVAEDDKNLNRMICAKLKQEHYSVFPAFDGQEALDIMEREHIDLVISDVMMPRMDGLELTAALRGAKMDLPVLIITAKGQMEDMEKGFRAGTDDYMVLIIVNTASKCGFTPQYKELQELYDKYKDKGLEILGFPCNQFGAQEPGSNSEVQQFCRLNYGVSFQIFEKGDVRGETAQPLFKYLTSEKGFKGFDKEHEFAAILMGALKKNYPEYLEDDGIKWNFTKFLIDREGNVVERFEPTTSPSAMTAAIEKLL